MATISTTISATSGSSTAQCTLTATYSVSNTSPTATAVTSTTLAVGAIRVSGGTSQTQASAKSSLNMSMIVAIVELTFGNNSVARTTGISENTTVTFSGTNSVAKGHSVTMSQLKLNALGKTGTVNISVPTRMSFAVTFDANSGDGAPSNQTKWYDEELTITSSKPNKTNYTCIGWATDTTKAGAGTVDYAPLATYAANAGLDLYAVWERNYQKPTIDNLYVDRCTQDGTKDDDGTYALVTFTWGVFRTNDPLYYGGSDTAYSDSAVDSCTIQVGTQTATPILTGASGTTSVIVGNGTYDTDTSYAVSISITDTQEVKSDNTTTVEGLLSMALFPLDINATATAIGFFRPAPNAPEEGAFFAKKVDAPAYTLNGTALIDFFYPIGSYYETSDTAFDPNTAWGGTWVKDSAGRVTVAIDTSNTALDTIGETGGNTDAIIPYHNHSFTNPTIASSGAHVHTLNLRNAGTSGSRATNNVTYGASGHDYQNSNPVVSSGSHSHSYSANGSVGYAGTNGNATNANMQPYIVVNRWHRTA